MPILIAIVAVLLVIAFALGGDWRVADESALYLLVAAIVVLFLVLFFLPYLQEFNRSEASRSRMRRFRKRGKSWALRAVAASVVLAFLAVWLLRENPPTAAVADKPVSAKPAESSSTPAPVVVSDSPSAPKVDPSIATFVTGWARTWSEGDVEKYLAAYSPDFVPADGLTRKAWETQRRQRVDKGRGIVVKVRDIRIENANPTHATVVFEQHYSARGVTDLSNKTLQVERLNGAWRIRRETAVAIPKTE